MPRRTAYPLIIALLLLLALPWFGMPGSVGAQPPLPAPSSHFADHAGAGTNVRPLTLRPLATNAGITELVNQVDGNRWHDDVKRLATFGATPSNVWGTRHLYSDGNLAARDWISATLAGLGWNPTYHPFSYYGIPGYNVVGERVGHTHPEEIYIVGAHFDSTSRDSDIYTLAPGAEDNASGTAALLEIARVLKDRQPASTVRLIAFSGEELGLIGSRAYVAHLEETTGELDNVRGMYNMDMIGFTSDPNNVKVVLRSYAPESFTWMGDLRDHLALMARTYTELGISTSDHPGGSDHFPFLREEVPAVALGGGEFSTYRDLGHYHSQSDVPDHVVPAQGAAVIKAVLAALAEKAGIVCMLADVTCDGTVTLSDLSALAGKWRLSHGQEGFNRAYDLNGDKIVNVVDLQLGAGALSGQ